MRAYYGEDLSWQDADALMLDWSSYYDLLGGTSWTINEWHYLDDGSTLTCFEVYEPDQFTSHFDSCELPPPDPPPGWPSDYPMSPSAHFETNEGPPCSCNDSNKDLIFDPSLGEWGGWAQSWHEGGCSELVYKIYPISYGGGNTTWRIVTEVSGTPAWVDEVTTTDGTLPSFRWHVGDAPWCPLTDMVLTLTIPV